MIKSTSHGFFNETPESLFGKAKPPQLHSGDALLIVDVQLDLLTGGSVAVPHGDEVVDVLNRYIALFRQAGLPVIASRDWHPPDHCSFQDHGGDWPKHCIAGTYGANFPALLELPEEAPIISKANFPDQDPCSAFDSTELDGVLRNSGVSRVFVGGLATDYCVLGTVRDALRLGYQAVLLGDAVRARDRPPGQGKRAVDEMLKKGVAVAKLAGHSQPALG